MEAIDEALSSLGESVKQSIYFHIENKFVARNEIPENIEDFQGGLEKIFGAGAQFIEILIMKNLDEDAEGAECTECYKSGNETMYRIYTRRR